MRARVRRTDSRHPLPVAASTVLLAVAVSLRSPAGEPELRRKTYTYKEVGNLA